MEDIYEPEEVFTKHQLHLKAYPNTRMIFLLAITHIQGQIKSHLIGL